MGGKAAATRFDDWLPQVTPQYSWDWPYLTYIREHLQRVTAGSSKRLMLFLPPRHGKSEMTTIRYPVWRLEREPGFRVCVGCYNQSFAERFGRKARKVARTRFPLSDERSAAKEWETGSGGVFRACGVGNPPTGEGFDLVVIDDPIKSREEADSDAYRERVWEWYSTDLRTRLEPGAAMILIQTRWHEDDLAGRILQNDARGQWEVVSLPALAEADDPLGREIGEALCPERYDETALADLKTDLGSYSFAALFQQRPSPPEGGIFKRHWWNYWQYPGQNLPPVPVKLPSGEIVQKAPVDLPDLESELQSWDMSFKDKKGSDFVCGQVWGRKGDADRFLKDQKKDRLAFTATCQAVRDMTAAHPKAHRKLVEDKANGTAVIDTLKHEIPGMIAVEPEGGKESRANAVSPQVESGNVYLPHPMIAPWVHSLINSAAAFPNAAHDDDVDAMTQALIRMMVRKAKSNPEGHAKFWDRETDQ